MARTTAAMMGMTVVEMMIDKYCWGYLKSRREPFSSAFFKVAVWNKVVYIML